MAPLDPSGQPGHTAPVSGETFLGEQTSLVGETSGGRRVAPELWLVLMVEPGDEGD